jgi:DNA gyrase/topoisomerase IV subunit A
VIRKSDIQWWLLEANKHPESVPQIIEELARRLVELDAENERLRNEALRMRRRPARAASTTEVEALQHRVQALSDLLQHQGPQGTGLVLLGEDSSIARLALPSALDQAQQHRQALCQQAALGFRSALLAQPADDLLALTTHGRGIWLPSTALPSLPADGTWPTTELTLKPGEQFAVAVAVRERPRFWTVVTRRGYVQRFVRVTFEQKLAQHDQLVHSPVRNDEPVAIVDGDHSELLLVSRWGQVLRFSQRTIEPQGSVAIDLEAGDEVAAALSLSSDCEVVVATASGYALRRDTASLASRTKLSAPGRSLIQARDVLALFPYAPRSQFLYLSFSGKLAFASLSELPQQDRTGKGTLVCDLSRDPAVAVVCATEGL